MNERAIEPRTALWAVAEVCWEDAGGTPLMAPATLEDTSPSGACLRVKTPITVGSKLTIKWHREEFSAVARNCRSDGREYLLGVRREAVPSTTLKAAATAKREGAAAKAKVEVKVQDQKSLIFASLPASSSKSSVRPNPEITHVVPLAHLAVGSAADGGRGLGPSIREGGRERYSARAGPVSRPEVSRGTPPQTQVIPSGAERKVMESKGFFPRFWGRTPESEAPVKVTQTEAPVNKTNTHAGEGLSGPQGNLLSYEDIYHAAGILSPRSGYGVNKVVEMLDSERIRDLGKDIKRASVLMALDAAATPVEDLLQDATRRQQALDSYEEGQRKQLEEFEARKARESAEIQAEMDRLTAHYAERIQKNQEQVTKEKEALRNWQMVKQHESQRIAEVIELCAKQPAGAAAAAAVGSSGAKPGLGGASGGKSN